MLLVSGGFLFTRMEPIIPKLDEGDFAFQAFLKPGTSLTEVTKTSTRLEQIVLENFPDEVKYSKQDWCGRFTHGSNAFGHCRYICDMTPKDQWTQAESKAELIEKVREKVSFCRV